MAIMNGVERKREVTLRQHPIVSFLQRSLTKILEKVPDILPPDLRLSFLQ